VRRTPVIEKVRRGIVARDACASPVLPSQSTAAVQIALKRLDACFNNRVLEPSDVHDKARTDECSSFSE